jgi:hypothetical protein
MSENKIEKQEILTIQKPAETTNTFLGKKYTYKIDDEKELQKIEIDKNLVLRVIEFGGKKLIDIRRYYKGFPTKRGVRFNYEIFETLKKIIE